MDSKSNEINVLVEDVIQTSHRNSIQSENFGQVSEVRAQTTQLPDFGHYWWCPHFEHQMHCPYPSTAFDGTYYGRLVPRVPQTIRSFNNSQQIRRRLVKRSKNLVNLGNDCKTEKLYSCLLCDQMKETKETKDFRKHIENHLGRVRPFLCRVCGKEFQFRSNCRNHLIAHSVIRQHLHQSQQLVAESDPNFDFN